MKKNVKYLFSSVMILLVSFVFSSCHCGDNDNIVYDVELNYVLTCSDGLLQFVTPVVTYTNENGEVQTITLTDADWTKSGQIQVGDNNQTITAIGLNANVWKKSLHFNKFNFESGMEVKYIAKEGVNVSNTDLYLLQHSLNWSYNLKKTVDGKIARADQNFNLDVNSGNIVNGKDIQQYIDKLKENPDKITVKVDDAGNVTSN